MKINAKALMALSAAIFVTLTSCSDDESPDISNNATNSQSFDITCEMPASIRSRGADANGLFGDGSEATKLQYQVWKVTTKADGSEAQECVMDSRNGTAPEATYNNNGTFSVKFTLLKDAEDAGKTGMYMMRLWADAWGNTVDSPFKFYWDKISDNDDVCYTVDYGKAFGTFDKGDAFFCMAHPLATLDMTTKNTTVTLNRPLTQVCVVTPEFNDKPDGYESAYTMHVVDTDLTNGNVYGLPNTIKNKTTDSNTKDNFSVPTNNTIVPTSERITINGKEMRYLYMGYIMGTPSKPALYFSGKTVPLTLVSDDFTNNKRIIIYPKNTDHGGGFYSEEEDFELQVIVQESFSSNKEYPVDN